MDRHDTTGTQDLRDLLVLFGCCSFSAGPLTILAPTDDAFSLMEESERSQLLSNAEDTRRMIKRIVLQVSLSSDILNATTGKLSVVIHF